jgi:demethoxyubiquinone hydroxylase (CLK1/Coq7/Cat5 family)
MSQASESQLLIALLQLAYSGELAAAYAYRGHWHSLTDIDERTRIREIENEEWHHRQLVGEMLRSLNSKPNAFREIWAAILGRALSVLCHLSGWLVPMYAAGRLESRNIREYETAAGHARNCGRDDLVDCLLTMAEVEWEHEHYFRTRVLGHRWAARFPIWTEPPAKETIRKTFEQGALVG